MILSIFSSDGSSEPLGKDSEIQGASVSAKVFFFFLSLKKNLFLSPISGFFKVGDYKTKLRQDRAKGVHSAYSSHSEPGGVNTTPSGSLRTSVDEDGAHLPQT